MKAFFVTVMVAMGLVLGSPSETRANPDIHKPKHYQYTLIADTTGPFQQIFDYFSINNQGTVAFQARLKTGAAGVFTGSGESITSVANLRSADVYSNASINDRGTVAFDGWPTQAPAQGIYTTRDGVITPVATTNDLMGYGFASLNNKGAVAYKNGANLVGEDPVWLAQPGAAPKQLGVGLPPSINDQGTVVFVMRLDTGNTVMGDWAVVASNNGGPLVRVADTLGRFGPISFYASINDKGTIAYSAVFEKGELIDGNRAIVTVSDGRFTIVADNRGGPFSGFGSFASINDKGAVAFDAGLRTGESGIFTGPDPVADRVIAQGDPLLGSTVAKLDAFSREGLNDKGEVAFLATLADGRQVLIRACPVNGEQKHGAQGAQLSLPL